MNNYIGSNENAFVTSTQAAEFLNVSLITLKKFISKGLIKTIKTPGGHHRIFRSDLLNIPPCRHPSGEPEGTKTIYFEIADILNKILERKQMFCHGHSYSVAKLSLDIAQFFCLTPHQKQSLYIGALLHDVGMIETSGAILNKKGPLNRSEYALIKKHPEAGEGILRLSGVFAHAAFMVRQHHERFDGKGYPDRLAYEKISLEAKIIALAEAFVSMTARDSYKETREPEEAAKRIMENSGTQFDPAVADAFYKLFGNSYGTDS